MKFALAQALGLAAAATTAFAAPAGDRQGPVATSHIQRRRPASIDDAWNDVARTKAKVYTAMQSYKANHGSYPPGANVTALDAIGKQLGQAGSELNLRLKRRATLPLTDQENQLYWTGDQSYGTPAQGPFQLDHDTGSSDTILSPGTFDPTKSSTAKNTGTGFQIAYGDGTTAQGPVYLDTLAIAGLTADQQAIGVNNGSSSALPGSGISGMAFKSISTFNRDPFFYTLVEQKKVPQDVFTFGLQRQGARLDLGGIDQSTYKGDINYVSADSSNGFWQISDTSINGFPVSTAIVDTGTSVLLLTPQVFIPLCLSIGGLIIPNGLTQLACGVKGDVPSNVNVKVGGGSYTLSPESLALQQSGDLTLLGILSDYEIGLSTGSIYGDTFLQNVLAVFSGQTGSNPRVGFAATSGTP